MSSSSGQERSPGNNPNQQNQPQSDRSLCVVGIGASAGGLSALEELFANLPADSGAAFVVIQHLSPDFKSLMKELLQRHTDMKVYRITHGMKLKPNSIFLIPPRKNLIVEAGILKLQERKKIKYEINLPIDLFFNSLAKNYQEKAIGVILTGSGSDGTHGLRSISEAGGITLVQEPSTAEFDSMPTSALATGVVNQALPVGELAKLIYKCIVSPLDLSELESIDSGLLTYANLRKIAAIILDSENVDFSNYKTSTMSRRIHRRRLINHLEDIGSYIELLHQSSEERRILCSDFLINVTSFFRDKFAWKSIENEILPAIVEKAEPEEELRFWIAGCSTGQEAYSLAILVDEALQKIDKPLRVKIFATDIDRSALEIASAGIYPHSIAKNVSSDRLQKYFVLNEDSYQIKQKIREMMIFSLHNLAKDAVYTRLHFASCRNVLIYMQVDLQLRILRNFHFALKTDGVLFLGVAESVLQYESEFVTLNKNKKIYQKQKNTKLLLSNQTFPTPSSESLIRAYKPPLPTAKQIHELSLKRLLNRSNSVVLIVDRDNQLIHVHGNSSQVLKLPDGPIVADATRIAKESLQLPLNTALHRAKKEQKTIEYSNVKLEESAEDCYADLTVIPPDSNQDDSDFYLVKVKIKTVMTSTAVTIEQSQASNDAKGRIVALEHELQHNRENLQALVEELEATNEEQQASNEELMASNEELQSTNEELHSVNEELHTVNIEYQSKIGELTQLNNDIDNLLKSTNIGVIFLDSELEIRKFTPAAVSAVSLRNADINRPLTELTPKFDCEELEELLKEVQSKQITIEREVKLKTSESYLLMRINPYHTEEDRNQGLVISFVAIDELKSIQLKLEGSLQEKNRQLAAIETATNGIAILQDNKFVYLNQAHVEMFGYSQPEELIGQSWHILYESKVLAQFEREIVPVLQDKGRWQGIVKAKHRDGHIFNEELTLNFSPTGDLICVCQDVSDRLMMENSLVESEKKYRYLYKNTPIMLHSIDSQGRILSVSNYWLETMGYSKKEVIGKKSTDFLTSESQQHAQEVLSGFFRTGSCHNVFYQWVRKDGSILNGLLSAISEIEDGKIVRSLAVVVDITEQRKKEELAEANRTKDSFLAHMSHELRTPLNSIIGFSHILKKDRSLVSEQLKFVDLINQSGQHLLTLVNNVLDISKLNANKLEMKYCDLNLAVFLQDIIPIFEAISQDKGLEFVTRVGEDVQLIVNTDETRLRQILFNLLSNAVKFTSTGKITLSVSCLATVADSHLKTIRFRVEDTGRGIPQDKHETIFNAFEQLNLSSHNIQGTGLGLPICQNILSLMGSKLHLTSEVGQGSCFWFDLDLSEVSSESLSLAAESEDKPTRVLATPCKVLVVDDNENHRLLLLKYFQDLGFTVEEAANGLAGMEIAQEFEPDVILIDLEMPIMDGKEMIEAIRQNTQLQNKTVFMVSANSQLICDPSGIKCDSFLVKPVDLERLLELLEKHLSLEWQTLSEEPKPQIAIDFVVPAHAKLAELLELSHLGLMKRIEQQMNLLEEIDSQYIYFANQVRQFTENCQQDSLEKWLKNLIKRDRQS